MKTKYQSRKNRMLAGGILALILVLAFITPVFAEGEDDEVPPDPGVGAAQDETKTQTILWVLPHGYAYYIDDEAGNIDLDWLNVDLENTSAPVEGVIPLTGLSVCGDGTGLGSCTQQVVIVPYLRYEDLNPIRLGFPPDTGPKGYQNDCTKAGNNCQKFENNVKNGGTFRPTNNPNVVVIKAGQGEFYFVPDWMICDPVTMAYCVDWNGDGSVTVVRIGEGSSRQEISNIQFWNLIYDPFGPDEEFEIDPTLNCPDVFVSPGIITVSAEQIAPTAAVVLGQDLEENGVTVEYHISIDPTIVQYQRWELLRKEKTACIEGVENTADYMEMCGQTNCDCPNGWHATFRDVYGCQDKQKAFTEELVEVHPGASLTDDSRAWIESELAAAYPGAHLLNPDWRFNTEAECQWTGGTCSIDFTLTIPAVDPGWYDIKLEGVTAGTLASPPRSFEINVGQFGVYLIDSTLR